MKLLAVIHLAALASVTAGHAIGPTIADPEFFTNCAKDRLYVRDSQPRQEVSVGERYEFGKNWQDFLRRLTPERIAEAEQSLRSMLRVDDLEGTSMLDIGSGSGLFSLAARRLGARVHSFDYDPQSVACTRLLRERFFDDDGEWTVEEGSVLDVDYLKSLGKFDLVYSWGVLHHTGAMWQALENAMLPVADGGRLFIAIYNTQPFWTAMNKLLKRSYVRSPGRSRR